MRIIAGTHRGRIIRAPGGHGTRPITDRVRENLFNILGDAVADAVVADCFAGAGTLGIEALSRGASHVTFVERDGRAIGLLKRNLEELGLAERADVLRHDLVARGIPASSGGPIDLLLFDPPYRATETEGERLWLNLSEAASGGRLAAGAIVVWRHEAHHDVLPPAQVADRLTVDDRRRYGSQVLTFIRAS